MTDEQLISIRARCAAATPGPWKLGRYTINGRMQVDQSETAKKVNPLKWQRATVGRELRESDAKFIAHAREDIPALLDEIARLRAEHDRYIAGTVNWDSGAVTWTSAPPFVHSPGYEAEG